MPPTAEMKGKLYYSTTASEPFVPQTYRSLQRAFHYLKMVNDSRRHITSRVNDSRLKEELNGVSFPFNGEANLILLLNDLGIRPDLFKDVVERSTIYPSLVKVLGCRLSLSLFPSPSLFPISFVSRYHQPCPTGNPKLNFKKKVPFSQSSFTHYWGSTRMFPPSCTLIIPSNIDPFVGMNGLFLWTLKSTSYAERNTFVGPWYVLRVTTAAVS